MKRKQQELEEAARRAAGAQPGAPGGAFGLPGQQAGQDFELPDEFKKFMG
jgi:signal recognition particle subunit SRP54